MRRSLLSRTLKISPFLSVILSTLSLLQTAAWSDGPVMPYTASELPVMATTPNLVYGSYGPQVKLDIKAIKNIPEPFYIQKDLEGKLAEGSLSVPAVTIEYASPLSRQNQSLPQTEPLTATSLSALAKKEIAQCADEGYLCDVSARLSEQNIMLTVTPMLVGKVDVSLEDKWQGRALSHLTRGIQENEPLKLSALKRQLRLIQANPDLSFNADLEVEPYTHQVTVKIHGGESKKNLHIIASANNLDQVIFGRHFGAATLVSNNVTGHGDSLMASVVQGYRSTGGFTRYEFPLRPSLRATLEAQYASISPFQSLYTQFDEHGWAYRISPGLKYTFLDRPNVRASVDVAFDLKNSKSHWGEGSLEREYVRTLRAGINYDQNIGKTYLSTRSEFAGAVPIWGGSLSNDPRLSWFKGGSQYFRYTGYAALTRPLPLNSTGLFNIQWQFTPNGLSNFDVGGLGGTFYGRGYREVYFFVDRYVILTSQWQAPAYFIPKKIKLPFSDKTLRDATQMLTFVDYGYGQIAAPADGVDSNYKVFSTGIGLRTQLTNRISGRLDIAYPIIRMVPFSQKPRLHFGVDIALR